MKRLFAAAALAGSLTLSTTANATVVAEYEVSNFNDGTAAHGLWTAGNYDDNTFSIDSGSFIIDVTGGVTTATLTAVATAGTETAIIDLQLSDWEDDYAYKIEGGLPTAELADFFTTLTGTIEIGGDIFSVVNCPSCGYAFQYGIGANAKNKEEFGGSSWIQTDQQSGYQHWDLNLAFTALTTPSSVPEPTALLLLGLGLGGIGAARKMRT